MVDLNAKDLTSKDTYRLLIGGIVPRPIAFVSTADSKGMTNVAPFSFFNGVCAKPPSVVFSVARKPDGTKKDTLVNIEETGEFVVNSVNLPFIDKANKASAAYPHGVSEFEKVGLTAEPSQHVAPPRVKEAHFQMECKTYKLVPVGDGGPGSTTLVIGEVVCFHVSDEIYQDGKILLHGYDPIARLGGLDYAEVGRVFSLPRPTV